MLRRIHRYKTWELHRGSWDPLMTSRLLEQGRLHRELATLSTFFSECHQSMDHKNVLKMVIGQDAKSSLTDLIDDEAKCIVCLHGAEDEASVNEEMPSAVRWILETTTRLIREMGEYVEYPSEMHWLDCCHQPIHVTCMIRSFYRMEESKCPHCRRMLASGLWGPIENVKIDNSLWPARFQDVDAFVQRRLTLTDNELFHLMQTWDEEEDDVLIGL